MLTSKGTLSAVLAASVGSAACFGVTSAFTAAGGRPTTTRSSSLPSQLGATVDPTVVTKKEYQDICGVDFDDSTLASRLAKTAYLYPKHVEVIDDFAPLVDKMVDEIVSITFLRTHNIFNSNYDCSGMMQCTSMHPNYCTIIGQCCLHCITAIDFDAYSFVCLETSQSLIPTIFRES